MALQPIQHCISSAGAVQGRVRVKHCQYTGIKTDCCFLLRDPQPLCESSPTGANPMPSVQQLASCQPTTECQIMSSPEHVPSRVL
jgi:hypothetical protein